MKSKIKVDRILYPKSCYKTTAGEFSIFTAVVLKHIEVKEVAKGTPLVTIQGALKSDSTSWGNYKDASFIINRGKYATASDWTLSNTWNV